MINIVCWKWEPKDGIHPRKGIKFTAKHVNVLQSMLERHLSSPFKLHCFTDKPADISEKVNVIPLWDTHRNMGGCYTRLRSFSLEMKDLIGPDFFSIDLDTIILQDITDLFEGTRLNHDFKIWGDTNPTTPYNGSFYYMKSGCKRQVWETFDPATAARKTRIRGYVGTDQAWIGFCLGEKESKWGLDDGIYSYRCHFQQLKRTALSGQEKIIFFHGSHDPSKPTTQAIVPWVKEHWR